MSDAGSKLRLPMARWVRDLWSRAHRAGNLRMRITATLVLVTLLALSAAGMTKLRTDTGPASFLPSDDRTLASLQDAAESFGGDPVVVLLETRQPRAMFSAKQLPKLVRLEGQLASLPDTAAVYGPGTVLNQLAASAQNMLASLSGHRDALRELAAQRARQAGKSGPQVRQAVRDALATFDTRYGSLLVRGLPAGLPTLRNESFADQVIFNDSGTPRPQWNFVVPAPDVVTVVVRPRENMDQASTEQLVAGVRSTVDKSGLAVQRATVTGVPTVTAGLGEQVRKEIPLIGGIALLLVGACYLLGRWTRTKGRRLLPLAITLTAMTLVLGALGWIGQPLSLGVIAFLPILLGIASDFPAYLAQSANRRQVVVAAVASAAAFASLATAPLPFVRDLGLALAAGQLTALGLALLLGTRVAGYRGRPRAPDDGDRTRATTVPEKATAGSRLATASMPVRIGVLVAVGLIASVGWISLENQPVEARPDRLAGGLAVIEDVRRAERILGASGEMQIMVRGKDVARPEVLDWMRATNSRIVRRHGDQLQPIVSPPSLLEFLGPDPTSQQLAAGMNQVPQYLMESVVRSDNQRAMMSYRLGLQDLSDQQRLVNSVRRGMPPPPPGISADVVGLPVAAVRGYELISDQRYLANTVGLASAGLVLLIGLARRFDAVRAIIASALAVGWGLAGAALLGIELSPLTLVLGSLNTAIACEFSVMFADAARQGRSALRRTVAVAAASAMLGYVALTASDVAVLREFGLMLAGTVALSFGAARLTNQLLPDREHNDLPKLGPESPTRTNEEVSL